MTIQQKKLVLVVDDDRDAANTLAILLKLAGCEAMVAYDTQSGIALAHERVPDFILHDIGLPIINGYDAARYLRNFAKFGKTTLVAVTAFDGPDYRERTKRAGFDVHVCKPLEFEQLNQVLNPSPLKQLPS
jgi:CheY-like chemotaxis protein